MIQFRGVNFSYPGRSEIFSELNFEIASGKTTGLMGPSGSGKTTILKLITGLLRPKSGEIFLGPNRHSGLGSVRGVLFHEDTLLPWLSVIKNVTFSPVSEDRLIERSLSFLNDFGVSSSAHQLPSSLSSGMRKRVELARALVSDDEFLILDEPFSALDRGNRQQIWKLWSEIVVPTGRTSMIITHDAEEAVALCDNLVVLDKFGSCNKPRSLSLGEITGSQMERIAQVQSYVAETMP